MSIPLIILCVILSIIALIVLLLSIPIKVKLEVGEKISLVVKYMFIKIELLPVGKKKEKEPKEEKPKEEKPKEEKPKEKKPKEKKPNSIGASLKQMDTKDRDQIIANLAHVLALFGKKFMRSIVFEELDIYVVVGSGDAASTAIKYGNICQKLYPSIGYICATNKVKKYDISVEPDFLAKHSDVEVFIDLSITVRKIINSVIGLVVRLIFSVVLKLLKALKPKSQKQTAQKAENK